MESAKKVKIPKTQVGQGLPKILKEGVLIKQKEPKTMKNK